MDYVIRIILSIRFVTAYAASLTIRLLLRSHALPRMYIYSSAAFMLCKSLVSNYHPTLYFNPTR